MKNEELKSLVKEVKFGRVQDRFRGKIAVCQMTLADGYIKNFKIDDDVAHLVKMLSENGQNPIQEWDVRNEISKEDNTYVGLFVTLVGGTNIQFLVEQSLLRIIELLKTRINAHTTSAPKQ